MSKRIKKNPVVSLLQLSSVILFHSPFQGNLSENIYTLHKQVNTILIVVSKIKTGSFLPNMCHYKINTVLINL